ncbi:MAG: hypothetical protein ABTQ25_09935 [Nitrosomonas ureae]
MISIIRSNFPDRIMTIREALINAANEMKYEVLGTQQLGHINKINEGASAVQRSDSLVQ